jgi:hypothetical protein
VVPECTEPAQELTFGTNNLLVDPAFSRVYGDVIVNGEVAVEAAYLFTSFSSVSRRSPWTPPAIPAVPAVDE